MLEPFIPFRLYKGVLVYVSVFFLFKAKNAVLAALGLRTAYAARLVKAF